MKKFRSFGGRSYHKKPKIPNLGVPSMGGNLGNIGNIGEIFEKLQEKIQGIEVEGNAGGGVVKIRMNGEYKVSDIEVDPSILDEEDKEMLFDLLTAAFNDAVDKVNEEKTKLLGDLGLGDVDLPFL